jgi:hypothetical protein
MSATVSVSPIEDLIKETRHAFIIAKSDGHLDISEIIQIAVTLSQKIQKLSLSGMDKKALLLLTLKKALDASGGVDSLPAFKDATAEAKAIFEEQLLKAASTSIDMVLCAASGKLDLTKPSNWKNCLPMCFSMAQVFLPKDQAIISEAAKYAETVLNKSSGDPSAAIASNVVVTESPESTSTSNTTVLPGTVEEAVSKA